MTTRFSLTGLITAVVLAACQPQPTNIPTATVVTTQAATETATPAVTETSTPTAIPYPLPASTTIYIEPTDYTPEQIQLMQDGIVAMYNYLRAIGLQEDPGPIAMYSFHDKQKLIDYLVPIYGWVAPIRNAQTGHAGGHLLGLGIHWTGQPTEAERPDVFWFTSLSSLYFEVVLTNLAGRELQAGIEEPQWLLQGGWNYFSFRMSEEAGYDRQDYRYGQVSEMRNRIRLPLDQGGEGDPIRGFFALEYLFAISPAGEGGILDFYRGLGEGLGRDAAFEQAFQIRISDFYEAWEAYADVRYPRFQPSLNARLVDSSGNPVDGVWVWACPVDAQIPAPPPPAAVYECVPVMSGSLWASGEFWSGVNPGEILIAFGTGPDPESIFGYYRRLSEPPPTMGTGIEGWGTFREAGEITPLRGDATVLTLSLGDFNEINNYVIYITLPDGLLPVE